MLNKEKCSILKALVIWTIWHGTFQGWPILYKCLQHGFHFDWFRPRSVGKQQFYWKTVCWEVWFLKFWVSKFSSLRRRKKTRCKMFHVNRLLLPIHRENGVSSQTSRVHGISARGFALYETKTLTFTQGRPCWNRRLGFPRFFSQIVVPPFLGTKLCLRRERPSLVQI